MSWILLYLWIELNFLSAKGISIKKTYLSKLIITKIYFKESNIKCSDIFILNSITLTKNSKLYNTMIYQIISTISRSRFDRRVRRPRVFITALWPKLEHLHCSHFGLLCHWVYWHKKVTNAVQGCPRAGFHLVMKVELVLRYLFFVISYLRKLSKRLQALEYIV